jgi:hypothetical protein
MTVVTTTTEGDAVVFGLSVVLDSSWLDTGVLDVEACCCVLEGVDESVLCGVLVETGVLLVGVLDDAEGDEVADAGVDEGVEETTEFDGVEDACVDVAVELPVLPAPTESDNPPVTADARPPSNPPSFVVACRRRMFASNQFACAMATIIANTDSSRK